MHASRRSTVVKLLMTMPDQTPREQHDEEDDGPEFNEPGEG